MKKMIQTMTRIWGAALGPFLRIIEKTKIKLDLKLNIKILNLCLIDITFIMNQELKYIQKQTKAIF